MARYAGRYTIFLTAVLSAVVSLLSCNDTGIFSAVLPGGDGPTSLLPVPVRREYLVNTWFDKTTDLSVLAVYPDGSVQEIPIEKVSFTIEEEGESILLAGDIYSFDHPGERIVITNFEGKSARYAIMVLSGSSGGQNSGGTFFDIIW
jgi:hypothetical protein